MSGHQLYSWELVDSDYRDGGLVISSSRQVGSRSVFGAGLAGLSVSWSGTGGTLLMAAENLTLLEDEPLFVASPPSSPSFGIPPASPIQVTQDHPSSPPRMIQKIVFEHGRKLICYSWVRFQFCSLTKML